MRKGNSYFAERKKASSRKLLILVGVSIASFVLGVTIWYVENRYSPFSLEFLVVKGSSILDESLIWSILTKWEKRFFFLVDVDELKKRIEAKWPVVIESLDLKWRSVYILAEDRRAVGWFTINDKMFYVDEDGFYWRARRYEVGVPCLEEVPEISGLDGLKTLEENQVGVLPTPFRLWIQNFFKLWDKIMKRGNECKLIKVDFHKVLNLVKVFCKSGLVVKLCNDDKLPWRLTLLKEILNRKDIILKDVLMIDLSLNDYVIVRYKNVLRRVNFTR